MKPFMPINRNFKKILTQKLQVGDIEIKLILRKEKNKHLA